jgi:quinohemoprotein amine dehydrogenase
MALSGISKVATEVTKKVTKKVAATGFMTLLLVACVVSDDPRVNADAASRHAEVSKNSQQIPTTNTKAQSGYDLMLPRCAGCHQLDEEGGFVRISDQRKTPEGWFMSIVRMERAKRVSLTEDERRSIIHYLSGRHGLAPQETQAYRGALEKRPNRQDAVADPEFQTLCARCHTSDRIALQRRTQEEWRNLVHFHVAQFPTLEYGAGSRDRDWWQLANTQVVNQLTAQYGPEDDLWAAWRARPEPALGGRWSVVGYQPGKGIYEGIAKIQSLGRGGYRADYELAFLDGETRQVSSEAQLYSGYEWRGATLYQGQAVREVFALSENGNELSGRWFLQDRDEVGGDWTAVRLGSVAQPRLIHVSPAAIKPGESKQVTLLGVGLQGEIRLGGGLDFQMLERSDRLIRLQVSAPAGSKQGVYRVNIAGVDLGAITVYPQLDYVKVTPDNAIARLGGGGGKIPPVTVQFEALGFANGPDGLAETADDLTLGPVPATWSKSHFDDTGKQLRDNEFAGEVTAQGLFVPAAAGINPARYIPTNNTGVLNITASVTDGERHLTGQSHLVVTVQRFIDPPIR